MKVDKYGDVQTSAPETPQQRKQSTYTSKQTNAKKGMSRIFSSNKNSEVQNLKSENDSYGYGAQD